MPAASEKKEAEAVLEEQKFHSSTVLEKMVVLNIRNEEHNDMRFWDDPSDELRDTFEGEAICFGWR